MIDSFGEMLDELSREIEESGKFNAEKEGIYISAQSYIFEKSHSIFNWYCESKGFWAINFDFSRGMSFDFTPELRDEMKRSFCLLNDKGREGYWEWIWQCIVERELDRLKPENLRKMRRDRPTPSF